MGSAFIFKQVRQSRSYSMVYLANGEVYIGKLTTFPRFQMKDAYMLQSTPDASDPKKVSYQLKPIKETIWSPAVIYLKEAQIVFYGPLSADNQIVNQIQENK